MIIIFIILIGVGLLTMICEIGMPSREEIGRMKSTQNYVNEMKKIRTAFMVDIGCGYYKIKAMSFEFYLIHTEFFADNKRKMDEFLYKNITTNELIPDEMKPEAMLLTLKRYKEIYFDVWMKQAQSLCEFCEYQYTPYPDAIARLYQPEHQTETEEETTALSPYTETTISALRGMGFNKKEATQAVAYANAELAGQSYTEGEFFKKALNYMQK